MTHPGLSASSALCVNPDVLGDDAALLVKLEVLAELFGKFMSAKISSSCAIDICPFPFYCLNRWVGGLYSRCQCER